MLDFPASGRFFDQPSDNEPARMFRHCFEIAVDTVCYLDKRKIRGFRNELQYLNAPMIRYAFEMPLQFLGSLDLLFRHTAILSRS